MTPTMLKITLSVFILCFSSGFVMALVPKGVVQLSTNTFDKIVPRFPAVLAKFDKQNAYGDKQKQFKVVAETGMAQKDLLVAEIAVLDRGSKDNLDLAERYGVTKADFPAYRLFVQGKDKPVVFTGDVLKADEIKRFIFKETGLWLGMPGCLEDFDAMIEEFFISGVRLAVIERAELAANDITDEADKFRADVYVKIMKNIIEKGNDFVKSELDRVQRLSEQKVGDTKKAQLKDRANILSNFQFYMGKIIKDEL